MAKIVIINAFFFLSLGNVINADLFSNTNRIVSGQNSVVNYLNILGPLKFNMEDYNLKWSSNPSAGYYKQEYLQSKESLPDFTKMLVVEYSVNTPAKTALTGKVKELEERKKSDPSVNYEVSESPDGNQFMLDFIISSGDTYEWNVYKYSSVEKQGKPVGAVLFGFCLRSSEKNGFSKTDFFAYLKKNRALLMNKMIETDSPNISIK